MPPLGAERSIQLSLQALHFRLETPEPSAGAEKPLVRLQLDVCDKSSP